MSGQELGGLTIPGATKEATAHTQSAAERARRFVAGMAVDVGDCRLLLDMLGLLPAAGEGRSETTDER